MLGSPADTGLIMPYFFFFFNCRSVSSFIEVQFIAASEGLCGKNMVCY